MREEREGEDGDERGEGWRRGGWERRGKEKTGMRGMREEREG